MESPKQRRVECSLRPFLVEVGIDGAGYVHKTMLMLPTFLQEGR